MKKKSLIWMAALGTLFFFGCGPSVAEQEKAKQEILRIEAASNSVDSTKAEVSKTSQELDSLLKQLSAQ